MCEGYVGRVKASQLPPQRKPVTLGEGFRFIFKVYIETVLFSPLTSWRKQVFLGLFMFASGENYLCKHQKVYIKHHRFWDRCSSSGFLQWALCIPRQSLNPHSHLHISGKQKEMAAEDKGRGTMNQFPKETANIFSSFIILYRSFFKSVSVLSIHIAILLQSSQAIRCLMLLCKISI